MVPKAVAEALGVTTTAEFKAMEKREQSTGGGATAELPLVIKADVDGTREAVCETLTALSTDGCCIKVIFSSVGPVVASDVELAATAGAPIIAFNVGSPGAAVVRSASDAGVSIVFENVIYRLIESVQGMARDAELLSGPDAYKPHVVCTANVAALFPIVIGRSTPGIVAGSKLTEGGLKIGDRVRLLRSGEVVAEGGGSNTSDFDLPTLRVSSLRLGRKDVTEVQGKGTECGIGLGLDEKPTFIDIQVGDVLEVLRLPRKMPGKRHT